MPNENSIVMLLDKPVTMEQARLRGFTVFTFHPTGRHATKAAAVHADVTGRKTISFDEVVEIEGTKILLHVMGETPRPKPIVRTVAARDTRVCRLLSAIGILEYLADGMALHADGAIILTRAAWHLKHLVTSAPRHNDKLNAFAWFMGEWAAKLKVAGR